MQLRRNQKDCTISFEKHVRLAVEIKRHLYFSINTFDLELRRRFEDLMAIKGPASKIIIISTLLILLMLAVCRTRVTYEPSQWPRSPWVVVAQWIERPLGVREVMALFPLGTC